MHKSRIGIIDGFRAISIIAVLLFHFFSTEGANFPYGRKYDFFFQGRFGVNFFFIISGFVIHYSLTNTEHLSKFYINRFIRLFPSNLIASTLTLLVFLIFSYGRIPDLLLKYLTSLSLVGTKILNFYFSNKNLTFRYIDYSLWSLWPEIQFYIIAGLLFFFNKKRFLFNFTLISFLIIILYWLNSNVKANNTLHLNSGSAFFQNANLYLGVFNISSYILYFTIGVLFFELYKFRHARQPIPIFIVIVTIVLIAVQIYFVRTFTTRITNAIMMISFAIFIYFPEKLKFLDNSITKRIGNSSYFLYLIHASIGLVLIERFGMDVFPNTFIFPLLLIVIFIVVSIFYTYKIEKPLLSYLKRR